MTTFLFALKKIFFHIIKFYMSVFSIQVIETKIILQLPVQNLGAANTNNLDLEK